MCVLIRHSIQQVILGVRGNWHYFIKCIVCLKQIKNITWGKHCFCLLYAQHATRLYLIFLNTMFALFSVFYYLIKIHLLCDFYQHTHYQGLQTFQKIQGEFRMSGFKTWLQHRSTKISLSTCVSKSTHNQSHRYQRRLKIRNTKVMYKGREEKAHVFSVP